MPFTFDMLDSRTLEITASGRLEAGDYAQLLPRLEGLIEREGSIALLVHVADLEGWSPAGAWEDLKFDARHYRDVTRVALVTDDPRARWYLGLFRLFTAAEVEVFVDTDVEAARLWVRETSDGAAAGRTPCSGC